MTEPKPRSEVENMTGYQAPLEGRRNFLRLDFNENTLGPSPKVVDALRKIPVNHIAIYPEYDGLREAVVANLQKINPGLQINSEQIGLFNGVDAAIHAIFHTYGDKGSQLLTTTPTFGYYTPCAHMQGMEVCAIPYEGENLSFPWEKIQATLTREHPKLLFICNPNNPTGTRVAANKLQTLAKAAPKTLVVVDELYEAFTGDSVLPTANFNTTPNLVILRSLAKTAGLAGLRIGFAIGNSKIIEFINRVTGPYDINSFAVTAAIAALEDQDYVDSYISEVLNAKEWITKQLVANGTRHHIDGGNYFLIWPEKEPSSIESSLRKNGILVRGMTGKPLIERSIRVSIGTTSQMKTFWQVFSTIENTSNHAVP